MADTDRQMPASGRVEFVAGEADAGTRLDRFLAGRLVGLSRSRIQAMIKAGHVSGVGGKLEDAGAAVKPGATVVVDVPEPEEAAPQPRTFRSKWCSRTATSSSSRSRLGWWCIRPRGTPRGRWSTRCWHTAATASRASAA